MLFEKKNLKMERQGLLFSVLFFGLLITAHGTNTTDSETTVDMMTFPTAFDNSSTDSVNGTENMTTPKMSITDKETVSMNMTSTMGNKVTTLTKMETSTSGMVATQTDGQTIRQSSATKPISSTEPTPTPSSSTEPTPGPTPLPEPTPGPTPRAEPTPEPSPPPEPTPGSSTTSEPCNCADESSQTQESDFGRVGFVAFGITFAIAIILLVILIIMIVRRKTKSGYYFTKEDSNARRTTDGPQMSMPMNDGGLDNVHTIDLDNEERKLGNGTGFSSFSTTTEKNNTSSFEGGATEASTFKTPDSESVNNLLHAEEIDKEVSDDDDDDDGEDDEEDGDDSNLESPGVMIGLKVEPSGGDSVESLEKLKETNRLMGDENKDDTSSIDDDLPLPKLSDSENEDESEDETTNV